MMHLQINKQSIQEKITNLRIDHTPWNLIWKYIIVIKIKIILFFFSEMIILLYNILFDSKNRWIHPYIVYIN